MSLGSLFLIREPVLRGLLYAMGLLFMVIAAAVLEAHSWQPDESRLILLVPFLSGAFLVAFAAFLHGMALRVALVLFFAVPAILMLTAKLGCIAGVFQGAMCA